MEKRKYKANFVKYETINGHTEFIVKFTPEENAKSFYIRDRYSSMRNYWNDLTSKYKKEGREKKSKWERAESGCVL